MVDLIELNKRIIEVAKQEFGIDMHVSNIRSITQSFRKDTDIQISFSESTYVNKSMKKFKLYIGERKLNEKKFSY